MANPPVEKILRGGLLILIVKSSQGIIQKALASNSTEDSKNTQKRRSRASDEIFCQSLALESREGNMDEVYCMNTVNFRDS